MDFLREAERALFPERFVAKKVRPAAASILDGRLLKEFRKRAGLSLPKAAELSGISASILCGYETGRVVPMIHRLKVLFRIYEMDLFDLAELLDLDAVERKLLKAFRRSCLKDNKTPLSALIDFMRVYSHAIIRNKGEKGLMNAKKEGYCNNFRMLLF
jgi:transcriptional regulator with XRE-family HTH domain